MGKSTVSLESDRPAMRSIEPWARGGRQLLSDDARARLAGIASIAQFEKGAVIYREGDPADAIFTINAGVVTAYRKAGKGSEHIVAFLFPGDLFGLAEDGGYANSVRAAASGTAYRLPLPALRNQLSKDTELVSHIVCTLCRELRQAQGHALLLGRRSAKSKLAMFLQFLQQRQAARGEQMTEIALPMSRSDIAGYVGLTLPALSRAFHSLAARGIIKSRSLRQVSIADRNAFDELLLAS